MLLKKIMKAETMFISSIDDDHEDHEENSEISGGRLAKPHDFPWYLLIPVLKKNFLSVLRQFPTNYLPSIGLTEALYVMIHHYRPAIFLPFIYNFSLRNVILVQNDISKAEIG